ncbi:TPA: site-specific integrase, partial [Streptococcus agalactiae]
MTITKTKNGTYRLRVYIPEEAKKSLGIDKKLIEKRFKLRSDAKKYELELQNKIDNVLNGSFQNIHDTGDILFSEFYKNIWWNSYKSGQTTTTNKPPSKVTIDNTEIVFRLHILPLLGNYSINFLNQNKQVVLNLLTKKAEEYANFKVIRSYVNSIFDWAEELEYIEANRVSKTIKRIKATKKIMLQESKEDSDLFLSQ